MVDRSVIVGGQGCERSESSLAARYIFQYHQFMASSINNIRKRKRGRPPTDATPVLLRIPPDLLAPLDRWIDAQPGYLSRPEAIRYAIRDWLIGQGVIKVTNDREDRH